MRSRYGRAKATPPALVAWGRVPTNHRIDSTSSQAYRHGEMADSGFWGRGGRRKRAYRITVGVWTLAVVGFYLFLVVELNDWDTDNIGPSLIIPLTIVLPLAWFLGFLLIVFVFGPLDEQ